MVVRRSLLLLVGILLGVTVVRSAPQESEKKNNPGKPLAGYQVLVLQSFKVDPAAEQAGFGDAQAKLLQAALLIKLRQTKKLFDAVIDGASGAAATSASGDTTSQAPAASEAKKLVAAGTVTNFTPGSRAARYVIGFGAGAAKLQVEFVFQDAASGQELLRVNDHRTYWAGTFGGSKNDAMSKTAEGMAQSLTNDIKKNR